MNPWDLAGLPESVNTPYWYEWAEAAQEAEIEAEIARRDNDGNRPGSNHYRRRPR